MYIIIPHIFKELCHVNKVHITLKSFDKTVKGFTCFPLKYLKMLKLLHHLTFRAPTIIPSGEEIIRTAAIY